MLLKSRQPIMSKSRSELVEVPVKLFVGRFPRSLTDAELSDIFEEYGKIKECTILRDHVTRESKGCGFVRFAHLNNAIESIRNLNGKRVVDDSIGPLQVQFANREVERLGLSTEQVEAPPVKIFVGSLPDDFTTDRLFELFAPYGDVVETYIITDSDSGAPKGSGFVKMRTKAQANSAISALNKTAIGVSESLLEVRLAVSKLQRQRKLGASGHQRIAAPTVQMVGAIPGSLRSPAGMPVPKVGPTGCNVFVFHIPPDWTEFHLRQLFAGYGFLLSATVVRDKHTHVSRGFGFVSYDNPFSAQAAVMHMNGLLFGNKRLKVQLKRGEGPEFALIAGG